MPDMLSAKEQPRLFYGWVIVGVGFVAQMIIGLSNQALGTYVKPFQKEFGWSSAQIGFARSFSQAENALLGPVNGWLVDRFGARFNMTAGVFFFGLGLCLFGFIRSLWIFYAASVLMALGASMGSLAVISAALNNWFRRRRTLAIAIATCGLGLSGAVLIPLIVFGQENFGWRAAAVGTGIGVWFIGIPAALLLRHSPERYGLLPDGDMPGHGRESSEDGRHVPLPSPDFTLTEALRTRSFWLISLANAFAQLCLQSFSLYQFVHMEQDMGIDRSASAFVIMVMSLFNIGGRLVGGVLGDMMQKRHLLGITMMGMGIALVWVAVSTSYGVAMATGALYGLCWGIRTPVTHAMRGDYFGSKSFGKITGFSSAFASLLGILGPTLIGALADVQGNYNLAFIIMGILSLLSGVMFSRALPPVHSEQRLD